MRPAYVCCSGCGVRACGFCPGAATLATAGDDDTVCLWEVRLARLFLVFNI